MKIKMLVLLVAAAALSGCAVYPAPYETYGDPGPAYVTAPPVYIYGSGAYRSSGPRYAPAHPGNYRSHPGHGPREGMRGRRDRDRDGVPDRHDRRPGNPHVR